MPRLDRRNIPDSTERSHLACAVLGLLPLLCLACGAPAPPRDSLTVAITDDILSLDPNVDNEAVTVSVLFNVYEPLVGLDDDLKARPLLAESWEHPSPERWRFHLRPNVRFQDGTKLTAELVRDGFLAIQSNPNLDASYSLSDVQEIALVDDLTIDLVTQGPRSLLASLPFVYVCKRNGQSEFPPLVGTGAYRVKDWKRGQRVVLERWEEYWGGPPPLREVILVPASDPAARLAMLREGRADIIYSVPPELTAENPSDVRFVSRPGLTVFYLGFNVRKKPGNPFANPRVRKAFHLALDRRQIVAQVLKATGAVPTQPVAPLVFGYNPDLPPPVHDPARAATLMAEAGYPSGFKTRLDFQVARRPVALLIQEQLKRLRVDLELNGLDKRSLYDLGHAGSSEFFLVRWDCASGEASEFYEFCLHTPTSRYGRVNYGHYSSPTIDEIVETHSAILDPKKRSNALQKAAAIVMEELPVLPLFIEDDLYGVRKGVVFHPRAERQIRLADVSYEGR